MFSSEFVSDSFIHLNSCDRQQITKKQSGSFRPYGRLDWHILYIAEGVCHVTHLGQRLYAPAGSIVIYPPGVVQDYYFPAEKSSVSYYAHFSGTSCLELLSACRLSQFGIYSIGKSPELEAVFSAMITEHHLSRPYSAELCKGYLIQIITLCARKASLYPREKATLPKALYEKLYNEHSLPKSIKEYADFCAMSTSRFIHVFTAENGISPKKYIMSIRMKKAAELLENTLIPISEVASLTGFPDQNYFSRCFKKYFGISPRAVR